MIAILGAGSLGRLWAAKLPAGRVAFVPRPEQSAASLRYRFRPVQGPEIPVQIPWLNSHQSPSLLLVTTKAGDTVAALQSVVPRLPETTPIVLFQNGLGSQQDVAQSWPNRPILAATTTEGANRPKPELTLHAGQGETWIGALTPAGETCLNEAVSRLAETGLCVNATPDILDRLWQKLVINAGINPFTAILNCPNGEILNQPFYQQWIDPLCHEISKLLTASGQPSRSAATLREAIESVACSTAANTSSMRADRLAGRTTEINFINGYLARAGTELGIDTPVNQMLTDQVEQLK
ncbi:ketopantoate reductase family protein [Marinobacter litoralis]|uniref:ketopantoate reductase family protein n=1 Tax=Marinobacter litoralis TaxID=187981 RepID=UPI0018EB6AB3|nr:2-dehydropantoate 2-reductase [Marinobacter litoralis]MBJ6138175.1 2-dehydropantoate 2-reductase [Marinobacter litoralis]